MRSRLALPSLLSLTMAVALPARADTPPTVWDFAKDHAERDRWALHLRVEGMLPTGPTSRYPEGELRLQAARAMLEDVDAEHSPDVRLRFDLGYVYSQLAEAEQRLDLQRRVVEVLAPALESAPDHPGATQALSALAYAYAKLNLPREELVTWRRYVPRLTDDAERATEMMNMGEAEMRLGMVDDALSTFREVMHLCDELPNTGSTTATLVLTMWDLAVGLDRSGDPRGAMDMAAKAMAFTWQRVVRVGATRTAVPVTGWKEIQDTSTVFFVPQWERDWYLALGDASAARTSTDPRDAARLWASSERHWSTYVTQSAAAAGRDPWLPIARLRLAHAQRARAAAEARVAKLPRERGDRRGREEDP